MRRPSTKGAVGSPAKDYAPDAELIKTTALKYRWQPEYLRAALVQFGQLPISAQAELVGYLVEAYAQFQSHGENVKTVTEIESRKQIEKIEATARKMLSLLGINVKDIPPKEYLELIDDLSPSKFVTLLTNSKAVEKQSDIGASARGWLSTPERGQRDLKKVNDLAALKAEAKQNEDDCNSAIVGLCWIYQHAKAFADRTKPSNSSGRGGLRHEPGQIGQLIRDSIVAYAQLREAHPESGPEPGCGGPMSKFVISVAALFGTKVEDSQIKEVWRTRKKGDQT